MQAGPAASVYCCKCDVWGGIVAIARPLARVRLSDSELADVLAKIVAIAQPSARVRRYCQPAGQPRPQSIGAGSVERTGQTKTNQEARALIQELA
ncbi:hypothetical protein [Thermoleptolyngbya sp. PKUAC-SCTB121]|nr:hypothetical protein [Thermoleptolyngbya sp. PKUAC-SCTB121]